MTTESSWRPRSVYEQEAGCVWLPRLVDKGRRHLEGERKGKDLLLPYMYGDGDYMDALLLQFLGLSGGQVLDLLRQQSDDTKAMREIVRRSGRTPEQCAAWSRQFQLRQGPFLVMIEADDGRRGNGVGAALLRLAYNAVIFPIGRQMYSRWQRAERKQAAVSGNGHGHHGWQKPWARPGVVLGLGLVVGLAVAGFLLLQEE